MERQLFVVRHNEQGRVRTRLGAGRLDGRCVLLRDDGEAYHLSLTDPEAVAHEGCPILFTKGR